MSYWFFIYAIWSGPCTPPRSLEICNKIDFGNVGVYSSHLECQRAVEKIVGYPFGYYTQPQCIELVSTETYAKEKI